jgi:hypothetical protein
MEVKLAMVEARREDAKMKAELESRMIALKEAKAMKEPLAEEREIMMMRTDDMDGGSAGMVEGDQGGYHGEEDGCASSSCRKCCWCVDSSR